MKKVPGWKKIEIVCVIIVVAFMSFLIGIYYQSRTERGSIRSLCSGWYQMKDGKRIELELPCSVTADAEGKVILYNDTLTEDDRGLIVSTRGIQDNLEIRTGERILYHYADNQFQKNKQMKGKMWADVRLPEETGQEPLCFIYEGTAGRSLDIQVPILGSFSAIIVRHLQASAFSILMIGNCRSKYFPLYQTSAACRKTFCECRSFFDYMQLMVYIGFWNLPDVWEAQCSRKFSVFLCIYADVSADAAFYTEYGK